MKQFILFFLSVALLNCSNEESNHKKLFFTFEDQYSLAALATTEIEPETNQVVALHIGADDPEDVAFNPENNNVYISTGQNAEILVYEIDDISNSKILFKTQSGVGAIAIDITRQKFYWVNRNQGTVHVHNLDGTGTSTVMFGGANITNLCSGLVVDPAKNRLYLLDAEVKRILVADLNTTDNPHELVSTVDFTMENPHDLEISADGITLYWVDTNRILQTNTNTGDCTIFRPSAARHIFLHPQTNNLYVSFSREVSKTEIGGAATFQRVFRDEEVSISHVVVR